ncbi:MAG: DUF4920 domain-containing protein [Crocinitomicaceae bacterium]
MKNTFILIAIAAALYACGETQKNFGPAEVDPSKAISVKEMLTEMDEASEAKEFTFEGELTEVCSKAGCWVNIDKGDGETFMVRFKDHFTIPTDTKVGASAYFHGTAYWDTIPVDMLQHFAEDAGKSKEEINAINEPKFELGFEADGILLK